MPRRLVALSAGLIGLGVSLALLVKARLGLDPWDVFNQGIARHMGVQIGWAVDIVGAAVLLAWIPLHQRVGVGTLINVVVVGLVVNGALDLMPTVHGLAARVALLGAAIVLNGLSTSCYIGAGLGPGPRDGLMTGFVGLGHSVRVVRTALEVTVLAAGYLLGGTVGLGAAYAVTVGPLVHFFLPRFSLPTRDVETAIVREPTCNS